ncbi:hypothetical protein CYMTET_41701 [Cymbomonas tetramitiformis]|uniref:EF-hand domain-containing protein n=1 Tax=Cymbomonas tetramitiformis TaxID=36881 RepID=A0AAE0C7J1_9CHLO|nr:hypothetical protein CYMTET_41701 [Cymbomonas tetramitiformis]|eukprot:gene25730-31469_t
MGFFDKLTKTVKGALDKVDDKAIRTVTDAAFGGLDKDKDGKVKAEDVKALAKTLSDKIPPLQKVPDSAYDEALKQVHKDGEDFTKDDFFNFVNNLVEKAR